MSINEGHLMVFLPFYLKVKVAHFPTILKETLYAWNGFIGCEWHVVVYYK